ncbi:MAG: hypothetical protein H6578_06480 [Chitinophagales bacterium]|nr:hypothetical protein [Chitinophagales bacterium]
MNVTFDLKDQNVNLLNSFMDKKDCGIEGHRTRGGYRALYNMMPLSHVEYFVACLKEFGK